MKKLFINIWKVRRSLYIALFGTFLLFSCGHGNNSENRSNVESLAKLTLKTFKIKGQDASFGTVIFEGESVTINQNEIDIVFNEKDAPKDFKFSKKIPITLHKGVSETFKVSTAKTSKYEVWEKQVILKCTNLEVLKIKEPIRVHGVEVKNGSVTLKESLKEVKEGDVDFHFVQADAPAFKFEGLPIQLKMGETKKFKIVAEATAKYEKFGSEITINCEGEAEPSDLVLKKITVHDIDVKDDKVSIPSIYGSVTKENIKIYFESDDWSKEILCEPEMLTLVAGEEKNLKVYVNATSKYKKFEKTIMVRREEKKELHAKLLTIHDLNALGGSVTIKEENVTKDKVVLAFSESDAPSSFNISPAPFTLNKGEKKELTISTEESEKYKAWSIKVDVKRVDENTEKTIDDAIEALKNQSNWVDARVDSNIVLLTTIAGFENSSVIWKSLDEDHCDALGKIKRDIIDVRVELNAKVTWKTETKEVTFSTTIERYKKITKQENGFHGPETITWDFSEENILKFLVNGKVNFLWEIKNVNPKGKQFFAKLKKKMLLDELLDVEDSFKKEMGLLIESINKRFGDPYVALKKKAVITLQDFKAYISNFDPQAPKEDKDFFEYLAQFYFSTYSGSFSDFNALSNEERTKIFMDLLNEDKKEFCEAYDIPMDTADEKLAEKFAEKNNEYITLKIKKLSREITYKYDVREDDFVATSVYDDSRKWCEQFGEYSHYFAGGDIKINTESDGSQVHIFLYKFESGKLNLFIGECQISQSDSFTLRDKKGAELKYVVSDVKDGEFTLTTTGAFTGTFKMKFKGINIEKNVR